MKFPERVIIDSETVYVYKSWGIVFGYQGDTNNRVYTLGNVTRLGQAIHDNECIVTGCACMAVYDQDTDDTGEWWGV